MMGDRRERMELKRGIVWIGGIFLCAFFCCVGIQMIGKDAGVLQMEAFQAENRQFRALEGEEMIDQQLKAISDASGIPFEKLLAGTMLKSGFRPEKTLRKAEVISDALGYERLDKEAFLKISSYYKRMYECVEYLPVADVYVCRDGSREELRFDAQVHCEEAETTERDEKEKKDEVEIADKMEKADGAEEADFRLLIPVDEAWRGIVPVVCMKTGTAVLADSEENMLCLEQENGISIIYRNLKQDLKEWQTGDVIEGGTILGSVEGAGLLLQFRLRSVDGSWLDFQGFSCLLHDEKKLRSVTQMLP
ncbi:MAG: hypothetical protein ACI4D3_08055 [Lachnospiraceae bacterium]